MNYLAKLKFEVDQENGKTKKIREQFLVEAATIGDAEKMLLDQFGTGISPCQIEGIQESKILGYLKQKEEA
jgi:hypothetical protein